MSIKSDNWIRKMAEEKDMIKPFTSEQVRHANNEKLISDSEKKIPPIVVSTSWGSSSVVRG